MNIIPEILGIPNVDRSANNIDGSQSELYVFRIGSPINQKSRVSFDVKSKTLYKISFTISEVASISKYSILSFSHAVTEPIDAEDVTGYESYFTKNLLNKESIKWSDRSMLFKSGLPTMFLINRNQEWRLKGIFDNMLEESGRTDLYRNEMMQTFIQELILFSPRLRSVNPNSV